MAKATPTKSRAPFYGVLLLFGVAGAVGIWYSIKANTPKPITLDAVAMASLPKAEGYLRGDPNAPITIMEFADFECPGCGQFAVLEEPEIRARIIEPGLANFRYFDFPLPSHTNSLAASLAASCAADQGKFWEMHDAIYAGQDQWNGMATGNPRKVLDGYAKTLGVDMKAYSDCYSTQKNLPRIQANKAAGDALGVNSTPTLVIGDRVYAGGVRFDGLKKLIDSLTAALPNKAPATDTTKK
ncbi:MAG: thioredoxin domain-containing protein [Gemmatimonas sp.]